MKFEVEMALNLDDELVQHSWHDIETWSLCGRYEEQRVISENLQNYSTQWQVKLKPKLNAQTPEAKLTQYVQAQPANVVIFFTNRKKRDV